MNTKVDLLGKIRLLRFRIKQLKVGMITVYANDTARITLNSERLRLQEELSHAERFAKEMGWSEHGESKTKGRKR